MSIQAISWALDQSLPPVQKLVLTVISNYAYKTSTSARLSVAKIADKVGLSTRMVRNHLSSLEDKGLIRREGSVGSINTFCLNMPPASPLPGSALQGGTEVGFTPPLKPASPNPYREPEKEPDKELASGAGEEPGPVLVSAINCTEENDMSSVEEKLAAFKATGTTGHVKPKKSTKVSALADLWKTGITQAFASVKYVAPFTQQQLGQFKLIWARCPDGQAEDVVRYTLNHWPSVKSQLNKTYGVFPLPDVPTIPFVLKNIEHLVNIHTHANEMAAQQEVAPQELITHKNLEPAPKVTQATGTTGKIGGESATLDDLNAILADMP